METSSLMETSSAASSGTASVKMEVESPEKAPSACEQVYSICQAFPDGVSNSDMEMKLPSLAPVDRMAAINQLLSQHKIILQQIGNQLIYKLKAENREEQRKLKGCSREDVAVYEVIQEAGNKGIWMRDIRAKCGDLKIQQLNKIIKTLETRKLIKGVKSVEAKRKKMYMLYDLEPDKSVSGGIFHFEGGFDEQVISAMRDACSDQLRKAHEFAKERYPKDLMMQRRHSLLPSVAVWRKIVDSKLIRAELTVEHVEQILDTFVYDGKAEREFGMSDKGKYSYRVVPKTPLPPPALLSIPCTFCPYRNDCTPGGAISPETCAFFKDWLS